MAYSAQDLANLQKAISSGQLELQLNGRRMRYQSTSEMLKLQAVIEQDLAAQAIANGGTPPRKFFRTRTNSGL